MKKIEVILFSIFLIGYVLKSIHLLGGSILLAFSALILFLYYFFLAIWLFNSIGFKDIFRKNAYKSLTADRIVITIFAGLVMALNMAALPFKILHWPGVNIMMTCSITLSIFLILVLLIMIFGFKQNYTALLLRTSVFLLAILFVIPLNK